MSWTGGQPLLAAAVVVAMAGAIAVTHSQSAHAGEHFVSGRADPRDVTVKPWRTETCHFDSVTSVVEVPVKLSVAAIEPAEGWVTMHVSATVSQHRSGEIVASATEDVLMHAVGRRGFDGDWVNVPLDQAQWSHGAHDCTIISWTITSG